MFKRRKINNLFVHVDVQCTPYMSELNMKNTNQTNK